MGQLARFGLILGGISLVATLVLATTYEITKPKIEARMQTETQAALKNVMPDADSFEAGTIDGIEYFEAVKGRESVGYCIKVAGSGYGGYMRIIVGIDLNGVIKGVDVLEHNETPGLGSKIKETRPGESEPYFLRQFKGKDAASVALKKDIDAITGATISSRAVTDAVRETASEFLSKISKIKR